MATKPPRERTHSKTWQHNYIAEPSSSTIEIDFGRQFERQQEGLLAQRNKQSGFFVSNIRPHQELNKVVRTLANRRLQTYGTSKTQSESLWKPILRPPLAQQTQQVRFRELVIIQSMSGEAIVDTLTENVPNTLPTTPSPLIDRLGTAEGRARALASLQTLHSIPADAEENNYDIEKALATNPFILREVTLPEE